MSILFALFPRVFTKNGNVFAGSVRVNPTKSHPNFAVASTDLVISVLIWLMDMPETQKPAEKIESIQKDINQISNSGFQYKFVTYCAPYNTPFCTSDQKY